MSLLTKENLLKAGAALAIIFFVLELFVVFLYPAQSPSNSQQADQPSEVEEQFLGISPAPFAIREFTGIVYFICNLTANTTTLDIVNLVNGTPGVLGKPLVIGQAPLGYLFLVRTVNSSQANALLVNDLNMRVAQVCNQPLVYREALVYYNSSTPLAMRSTTTLTKTINVSKLQFDSYTDQYGIGVKALVTDANAVPGSVIMVQSVATLIGDSIKPGSLMLEQLKTIAIIDNVQTSVNAS